MQAHIDTMRAAIAEPALLLCGNQQPQSERSYRRKRKLHYRSVSIVQSIQGIDMDGSIQIRNSVLIASRSTIRYAARISAMLCAADKEACREGAVARVDLAGLKSASLSM